MTGPPRWSREELAAQRDAAIRAFRVERLREPVGVYPQAASRLASYLERFFECTVDLRNLDVNELLRIVVDKEGLDAFRYLASPPISSDDLKTLADVESLAPGRLRRDPELIRRLADVVTNCIDRKRFPWLTAGRDPTGIERHAAILASATLMACQRVETDRRNLAKSRQEESTKRVLTACGFAEVGRRDVTTLGDAPADGEFCGESKFGTRKADVVVGLWDHRKLLVECKVSNSEVNSVKRLNNDAAAKAVGWLADFGPASVVPAAVLSGVYKLENLQEAQTLALVLLWAHELSALSKWLEAVRADHRLGHFEHAALNLGTRV